ncbi:alpha/beta fold hydrolase [Deinococcus alpinitundrae]|uniref:alpha/beta fold hydrolase n=1 Tax=Deinococcus alpinitundrae TaxID=468913 RepID=UPI00137AABEE|nr:alpha/beta hydrolase [Deinococcus alpinitundrae]
MLRGRSSHVGSTVISCDGTQIAYRTVGNGPSVIVVPGVLSTASTYADFADALSSSFTVHTIERRGRGLSGSQGKDYSVLKEREDVLALQNATGARFLVGHSYGGLVSLEAARSNLEFSRVAVYEPGVSVEGSISTHWTAAYQERLKQGKLLDAFVEFTLGTGPDRIRRTPRWLMKLMIPRVVKPRELQEMLSLLPENLNEHLALAALDSTYHNYREVEAEVLIMLGGRSGFKWVETAVTQLGRILPFSETRLFPTLDHFGINEGETQEVAQVIRDFFLR